MLHYNLGLAQGNIHLDVAQDGAPYNTSKVAQKQ